MTNRISVTSKVSGKFCLLCATLGFNSLASSVPHLSVEHVVETNYVDEFQEMATGTSVSATMTPMMNEKRSHNPPSSLGAFSAAEMSHPPPAMFSNQSTSEKSHKNGGGTSSSDKNATLSSPAYYETVDHSRVSHHSRISKKSE